MSVSSRSNSSLYAPAADCSQSSTVHWNLTALFITYTLLLLPLFLYVLYLDCRHCRKLAVSKHSDVFTLNMVSLELFGACGFFLYYLGTFCRCPEIVTAGLYVSCIISPGQTLFPLLTCVDLYLAVVHPIAYLGLKHSTGVLGRNVAIACVWLLCAASMSQTVSWDLYLKSHILFLSFAFAGVSFCCFSVLVALTRPVPGGAAGTRKRADPSRQRAFVTIMAVMSALFVRFWSIMTFYAVLSSPLSSLVDYCVIMLTSSWLSLPSSLVLPLLFLHRAGKLALPK